MIQLQYCDGGAVAGRVQSEFQGAKKLNKNHYSKRWCHKKLRTTEKMYVHVKIFYAMDVKSPALKRYNHLCISNGFLIAALQYFLKK